MAFGATFAFYWRNKYPAAFGMYCYAVAAGMIAGEGLGGIIGAILQIAGVSGNSEGTGIGCPMGVYLPDSLLPSVCSLILETVDLVWLSTMPLHPLSSGQAADEVMLGEQMLRDTLMTRYRYAYMMTDWHLTLL